MDEIHVQKKHCYVYQLMADKCNVASFKDSHVEPLCRFYRPVVMSTALEEVETGSVRPGGKMECMWERTGPSCSALNIICIINGSFCMYNFDIP